MTSSRFNFVCVDNSIFSDNGFDWYLNNCHRMEDTVGIVHVQKSPVLPTLPNIVGVGGMPMIKEYQKNIKATIEEARNIRQKFQKICKQKDLKCEFFTEQPIHSPGHVICDLAKEKNADAIIMGQRGHGTVSRTLLGSTSDYVLHHSTVPVLVVPPPPKES